MDANGTHFHLLLGKPDWAYCTDTHGRRLATFWDDSPPSSAAALLHWDQARSELTLQARLFQLPPAPRDNPPALADRRGAARDRFGNWYWIDTTARALRVNSVGTGVTSHFWSTGDGVACESTPRFGDFQPREATPPPTPARLSGLAITDDHYLVVGTWDPAGLLIFDLHAGGPPQLLLWSQAVAFVPFDMAPRPGGGVWILDREQQRYWALDRYFHVIPRTQATLDLAPAQLDAFQPVDQSTTRRTLPRTFPAGITLDAASPLDGHDPIAIEALPDGTVLILDRSPGAVFSQITRYRLGEQLGEPISTQAVLAVVDAEARPSFRLLAHDFAFVPEQTGPEGTLYDRLYIVGADGNQTFAFHLSQDNGQITLQALADYLPMRLFGGKGLVAARGQGYYDFDDGWIPLTAQRRPRYVPEATLETPLGEPRHALDGRTPDCVWHRLLLDACLPSETEVQVWSRAANDEGDLAQTPWQQEPRLYRRGDGSEQPFVHQTTDVGYSTWELLLQQARGRYLQLRLKLIGNGRTTPHLRALRVYYPRFSYLEHYLPAVYRDDSESASFVERFLANLEGFYTALEDKIAAAQILFDVRSTPSEALAWLAHWFGIALDPAWDDTRRRLLLKHAMAFLQYRGTIHGLQMALRLALDECIDETLFTDLSPQGQRTSPIRIIETYRTRRTPGVVLGDPTDTSGPRLVAPTTRWLPAQGGAVLVQRYSDFLNLLGRAPGEGGVFPITAPTDPALAAAWQQFTRDTLGFVPSATAADLRHWQAFLARRYQRLDALNAAYRLSVTQQLAAFSAARLPDTLPPDGAPLQDWYQFEAVVLAMHRTAHRFTILLPVPKTERLQPDVYQRRLDLARRIGEIEKPAHTIFDVQFYWALFRVGEVRLGDDTLLDRGSRAPQLLPPTVLGQAYLAESYLAPGHPQDVSDRYILGREQLSGE